MAYNANPPSFGNFDPSLAPNTINGAVLSVAQPFVESDKASKIATIFEGTQNVLQTAGDVYERLRYRPQPRVIGAELVFVPPSLSRGHVVDVGTNKRATNQGMILMIGALIVAFFVFAR